MAHINIQGFREQKAVVPSVEQKELEQKELEQKELEQKELEQNDETNGDLDDTRGTDTETTAQGAEKSLQPSGSDDGAVLGESAGGDGALAGETDTDNDVAGLGTAETKAKPKSRAKRV